MPAKLILQPVLALFLLTGTVWLRMYWLRIAAHRKGELSPDYMRWGTGRPPPAPAIAAARQFANLFEVPLLFYVTCLAILLLERVEGVDLGLAWSYVGLRAVQAAVHLTYNNPYHRFAAYAASCGVLAVMVARLALAVAAAQP